MKVDSSSPKMGFPPQKEHMEQNWPFDVFNGHDIFSQGQQYYSWSIPKVFELSKLFFDPLRTQKPEKTISKSPKHALFKAYFGVQSVF